MHQPRRSNQTVKANIDVAAFLQKKIDVAVDNMKLAVMNKLSDPKGPMTEVVSLASVIWCTSTTSSQKFRVVLWLGMIH